MLIPLKAVQTADHQLPYNDRVYLIGAVLDPNYGYIWLDDDHPGSEEDKRTVKQTVNGTHEWTLLLS